MTNRAQSLNKYIEDVDAGIPGPDVTCMDAAEMLVDGFIKDARLWPDPDDRNELVRRVGTLLAMQREALKNEYADLLASLKRCSALCEPHSAAREAKIVISRAEGR